MTTPRIESRSFAWGADDAKAFFDDHGYVVVDHVLRDQELRQIDQAWTEVVGDGAASAKLPPAEFVERFPQNRDLWRKSALFRALLFETAQSAVVRRFLGTTGVRLFHDQGICKPAGRSGSIPWHQDSAYWPLDRVGLSVWTPTAEVPVNGGCLKVLDRSHLDGPRAPQDFLASIDVNHDVDPRLVLLPVRRGQSVVLDGLTLHASGPNVGDHDRLAYLTLWVPATARFVPAHASWHPSSAHITSPPGELLEGEYFPLFGELEASDRAPGSGRLVAFPTPTRGEGPSMFTASKDIAAHLAWLLGEQASAPLAEQLATPQQIAAVVARLIELAIIDAGHERDLVELLIELRQQERVRHVSVARDVYLRTASRWWYLAGTIIEQRRRSAR